MKTCIIIINEGHDRYMGYACSLNDNSMNYKTSSIPVIKLNNSLIGILNDDILLDELNLVPLLLNNDFKTQDCVQAIRTRFLKKDDSYRHVIILTINNILYTFYKNVVNIFTEFDEKFLAFGTGSELAIGVLYGLRSGRYTAKQQIEIALNAVKKYYPELSINTGYYNI